MLARAAATIAGMTSSRSRCSVPESFRNKEEDEEEAEPHHNRRDPEHPPPTKRLHNSSTDQRYQILATKQEQRVHSESIGSLMKEEDLRNSGTRETFYRGNCESLYNASHD
jgi:hypothetical protein